MKKISLLCDYEYTLLRMKENYKLKDEETSDREAELNARYLLRFVFEELLHWRPQDVKNYLNADIIKMFKLKNCISKVQEKYPQELSPETDYFYIASYLYPDEVPYHKDRVVIDIYNQVLNKKISFPNRFFSGRGGKENFKICLFYSISTDFFGKSAEYIYEYFSSDKAGKYMKKISLANHYNKFYETIIEAVHDALPDADKNDLLYHLAMFNDAYNTTKLNMDNKGDE